MTRGTKIALILLGVTVIGVGVYFALTSKKKTDSGNKQKDERKVLIERTDK